eukprot:281508_1
MGNKNSIPHHDKKNNDKKNDVEKNNVKKNNGIPVRIHLPPKVAPFHENTIICFDGLTHKPLDMEHQSTFSNVTQNLIVSVSNWHSNVSVLDIVDTAIKQLNTKYHPTVYEPHTISSIGDESVHYLFPNDVDNLGDPIEGKKKDIIFKNGIRFSCVIVPYEHNPRSTISCEHLLKSNNKLNPMNCPIYKLMKTAYFFTEENLAHLVYNTHFVDEYEQKPTCKYGDNCRAYIRLKEGKDGLNERCHVKIYRHPPRRRNIKLQQDMFSFLLDELKNESEHFDKKPRPKITDLEMPNDYKCNNDDDLGKCLLKMLINEVINNGFEKDLCKDGVKDPQNKDYYIMSVVKYKLNHSRHKRIGSPLYTCHMLALILYTGCECNADLCATQRSGDYTKW